jgi:hypothetical protein
MSSYSAPTSTCLQLTATSRLSCTCMVLDTLTKFYRKVSIVTFYQCFSYMLYFWVLCANVSFSLILVNFDMIVRFLQQRPTKKSTYVISVPVSNYILWPWFLRCLWDLGSRTEYLGEFEAMFETAFVCESGIWGDSLTKKPSLDNRIIGWYFCSVDVTVVLKKNN